MSKTHIYGMGAALVDTEIETTDDTLTKLNVDKGLMTLVDESRQEALTVAAQKQAEIVNRSSGGSAANTIIAASYFGSHTFYSCKVSDDSDGKLYINDLSEAGVKINKDISVTQSATPTGKCLVFITPDAQRSMNTYLGISESISIDQIDEAALGKSSWVYIEGYLVTSDTGKPAAIKLRELAQNSDKKIAFSLSDPAMAEFFGDGLKEIMGDKIDLLFCNEQEALHFTGQDSLDKACKKLEEQAKSFAVTLGDKGARVFDGEQYIEIAPFAVQAIDTNGAGDMFAGAFLHAIAQGYSYPQAGKFASKASSVVVSQFGPRLKPEQHKAILSFLD